jgi:hypothetical protein
MLDKLPFDVFETIVVHLDTLDILTLTRVSQTLRKHVEQHNPVGRVLSVKKPSDYFEKHTMRWKKFLSAIVSERYEIEHLEYYGGFGALSITTVIPDMSKFNKVRRIQLHRNAEWGRCFYDSLYKGTYDFTVFKNLQVLSIEEYYHPIDLNLFRGLQKLRLYECYKVRDVSMLGNLHTLILRGCNCVSDVSALGNVYCLDLSMTAVTDVSALGNVYDLDLSYTNVADVSALTNVHTLKMRNCEQLVDVSSLSNVHNLDLFGCLNVVDVSFLQNVHHLVLSRCYDITDVSMLGNVHHLSLRGCEEITDVSMLGNVHTLCLMECINVTDVSMLGNVVFLNLKGCRGVTDISMLGNVTHLDITGCDEIQVFPVDSEGNQTLTIESTRGVYRNYELDSEICESDDTPISDVIWWDDTWLEVANERRPGGYTWPW